MTPRRATAYASQEPSSTADEWTPARLERLLGRLESARPALEEIPAAELRDAWAATVDDFLTPGAAREDLRGVLAEACCLSRPGLDAALRVILEGVRSPAALDIFREAESRRAGGGPAVAILASNLPALAVQCLLPALALRRPLLLKSASAEPHFAPAFLDALAARLPAARDAYAAATWRGGDRELEAPVLAGAGRVVAYGGGPAIEDLRARAGSKLVAHGPKASFAVLGRGALDERLDDLAAGVAKDVALFDQRGCLSIQAVITDGDPLELSGALARALERLAERWPPGPAPAGAVRQVRDEAVMRGLHVAPLSIEAGTVVVEDGAPLSPSPGRRTLRVHPVERLEAALELLEPWRGRIQGVAVDDDTRRLLGDALRGLGATRLAPAGELQAADVATWRNGGLAPLEAYA